MLYDRNLEKYQILFSLPQQFDPHLNQVLFAFSPIVHDLQYHSKLEFVKFHQYLCLVKYAALEIQPIEYEV